MSRYPALQSIVTVVFTIGVIAIVVSIIGGIACSAFVGFAFMSGKEVNNPLLIQLYVAATIAGFALVIGLFINGFLLIALSQSIQVVIDTEDNTRATHEAIGDVLEAVQQSNAYLQVVANNSPASTKLQARSAEAVEALAATVKRQ